MSKQIIQFITTPAGQITVAAAVVGVAAFVAARQAKKVATAINPINENNIFYSGVNAVGEYVTDEPFNLGYWLYDVINKDDKP